MTTICVASGKGGTGKTMLAVALAQVSGDGAYVDCDVEAPDGALFLHPEFDQTEMVTRTVARIDTDVCTFCGACADQCASNALLIAPNRQRAVVFDDLCTGCGVCSFVCPAGAVYETQLDAGEVSDGTVGGLTVREGRMNINAPHAHPTLEATLEKLPDREVRILDSEPGSNGRVMTTVQSADVALLIAEPTPFGLHDLELAIELTELAGVPRAVVINRCDIGDDAVLDYCHRTGVPVLMQIPFDTDIARAQARGGTLLDARPDLAEALQRMLDQLITLPRIRTTK